MKQLTLLVYVILAVLWAYVDCGCVFEEQTRAVGEVWHPSTFGTCVNCTCQMGKTGEPEVRCINTVDKCPKLNCDNPKKDPNMCCPFCEDIPNIPPTVQTGDDKSSSSARTPCKTSDGRTYNDGQRYSSNTTGLRPTSENQCVTCVCQNGQSYCQLKTCSVPETCSAFIESPDECCPVCADCAQVDGLKKNGSTWHPTIPNIGEIDCITCSCMNGKIDCKKNCTPDHELPCPHPKKPNGECCKTCPHTGTEEVEPTKTRKDKKDRKRDRKGKKRKGKGRKRRRKCRDKDKKNKDTKCRKRRKDHRKRDSKVKPETLVANVTASPGIDLDTLCIKKRTQFLMYKVQTDSEMSIAFDDIKANTVDVYMWTIKKDNKPELVSYSGIFLVQSPVYRRSINNTNVIGTIGNKQYRKFKKRLKEKLEKCKLDCDPKLFIKIVQRVKVNLLKFGDECKS